MKKTKLLLLFVLLMVFCLFLSGCSSKENTNLVNNEVISGDVTNTTKAKISVTVPDGWAVVGGSILPAQYMKNTASFLAKEEPSFQSKDLAGVVAEAKSMFETAFDNVTYVGSDEDITVDNKDAKKFTFTCEISGMQMKYTYVFMFVNNSVYAITFADLATTFDSLASDYNTILGNISFQ